MEFIAINGEPYFYQDLTIEDIIAWCKENNQTTWLKAKVKETRVRKIYPKGENGKQDKKAEPIGTKTVPISFMEIKREFAKEFCPDILPVAKPKKKSMRELIAEL